MAASSGWARRSATPHRSFTRAGRSGCASCARSSTSSKATGTFAHERAGGPLAPRALGILGGTFNPPHVGHVAMARAALRELALDRVLLMPARVSPHKLEQLDPGAGHRLRMCELAVADQPGIEACGLELERPGPSYTVDTLSEIHARTPATELTFILGADTACTLGSWREPRRLLELATLAVAQRTDSPRGRVLETARALAGEARIRFLRIEPIDVSSSQVRAAVAAGEPVEQLVGEAVAGYIERHGLYTARDVRA